MEMDLKSMKRKDLQALCKEHGIPANASNSQMIDSLSSILQEKMKPKGCLKGSGDSAEDLGIVRGGSKKVTFVVQDEKEDVDNEYSMNPVGKSKRTSVRRRSSIALELDEGIDEIETGSHHESQKNVDEVPCRTTRSRGLAESVLWSPVIVKKRNGTVGVRQNAEPSISKEEKASVAVVPLTRSLRNRVVVVGGDEESVTDTHTRNIQKRKNSDNKEQKENVSASLEEDEAVGKENPHKRSREGVVVKDEPPPRRPTRSHTKFEEAVSTEEVDIGRPKKRRKGGMEVLPVEKVVGKEIERGLKSGGSTKRSSSNTSDSGAMDSGDVTQHIKRSTRNTSALLESGTSVSAVGKLNQEGKADRKNKSENQAKGGILGSLLTDSEVVAVPSRKSTRSSSTLKEDASLHVGGKSIKGKSQKQVTRLPASVAVSEPVRRSTRSSSALQEESTSAISVGESGDGVEVVGKSRSQKQTKEHGLKHDVSKVSYPIAEAVVEPVRRPTRHTSNLVDDGIPLPVVRKSTKGGEKVKHGKSQKHTKDHGSTGGGSTASLAAKDVTAQPVRRSARSSSSSLEDRTSPVVGKSVKDGKASMKGRYRKQRKDHASDGELSLASLADSESIGEPAKKLTRSSPKMSEDEPISLAVGKLGGVDKAIRNNKPVKHKRDHSIERGGSSASLPHSRAATTPTRNANSSKKRKAHIIEKGVSTASLLDNEAVTMPERRSTFRSSKVRQVLRSPRSLHLDKEAVTALANRATRQSSNVLAGSEVLKSPCSSHPDNDASITPTRISTLDSLKVPADSDVQRSPHSSHPDNQTAITPVTRLISHLAKGPAEGEVLKSPCSLDPASHLLEDIKEDAHVKAKSLCEEHTCVQEGQIDVNRTFIEGTDIAGQISFPGPLDMSLSVVSHDVDTDVDTETASQMRQSPESVSLEKTENDTSLLGTLKDLDDMSLSSHITEGHSSFMEVENIGRGESPLNIVEGSSEVQEEFSGNLECSNDDATVEAGTLESYGDDRDVTAAPVDAVSSPIDNKKSSVDALDMDSLAGMESCNIISHPVPPVRSEEQSTAFQTEISTMASLKVPDTTREVDPDRDGIPTIHATYPRAPCKSSDELTLTSNAEASLVFASKEPASDLEICGASGVGLEGNESKYISRQAMVGKSSDELLHASLSPEVDPEEPELKVEVECPREDFWVGSGVDKILVTSNTEACLETCYRISSEESDSKVAVHIGNKGHMEGTEASNTACSPLSSKSAGVLSPTFLPTLHNEISPDIDIKEPDLSMHTHAMNIDASDIGVYLAETSGTHSKPLEVCLTAERDAGSVPNIQRSFDDEAENCEVDRDTVLTAQLAPEECDAGEKIDASVTGSESQSCICGEIIKETLASSTLSVMVNDGSETEGDKSGAEKNGDELRPSSPSENPTCDMDSGGHMKECGSPSSTAQLPLEENDAGKKIDIGVYLAERSGTHSKTLEVSMTAERDAGSLTNFQSSFDDEVQNCEVDRDTVLTAQLAPDESDASEKIDVSVTGSESQSESDAGEKNDVSVTGSGSQSCIGVEIIKETLASSTLSVMVNDGAETEGDKSGAEKNGDELRPSSPSENPTCDLDGGGQMMEGGSPSTTAQLPLEESDAGKKIEASNAVSEPRSCIGVEVIRETWVSSTLSVRVSNDAAPGGNKSSAEKDGDELMPSSLSENPACDLDTGDHMNEGGSPSSTAQLAPEECDVGEKIEASIAGNELQSCMCVEVIRETWVSSTSAVTVNDDTETEGDTSGAEKNGDERRSYSPSEHPLCDLDTGVHMKEHGSSSSTEDDVDDTSTIYSHGNSKKSDFTLNMYDKDQADAEENLMDSSDEKFSEDINTHRRSLDAFIIPDGPSYVLPVASKDGESTPLIATASSKAIEGNSSVDHGSSIQALGASGKFGKQLEKEDVVLVDVGSAEIFALATETRTPTDAVPFGGDTKAGDLPVLSVTATCVEEILPITTSETPATSGYKSSVNKRDIQELPCVPDSEAARLMSDGKEVALNVKDSLGVDSVDRSPILTFEGHVALGQLNEVANIAPETVHTAYELADVEHESRELGATVAEEMENVEPSESNPSTKGENDTGVKKTDSIGRSTSDHFDELCEKQDEAFLLQYGELHPRDVASHSTLDHSASTQGDGRVSSTENVASATDMENVQSLPKMDLVLAEEDQLTKCNTEKAFVEEGTLNMEEFSCSASSVPLADQKESPDTFECFEHASNAEEEGVAHGVMPMLAAEDLFCMDNEVATFVNDSAQVGQSGHHGENIGYGKCGDFLKINITSAISIGDGEMKAIVSSGGSDAKDKEDCPYNREISPVAENLLGRYAKPCADMDAQDIHFADQYGDQEDRRTSVQESLDVSKFRKEEISTVLDVTRIEGSPTRMSQIEKFESTLMPTVAEQEDLTARTRTALSVTNDADQVVFWDCKESSAMEGRHIGNELEDPDSRVTCTAQRAVASLDTGAFGINSETTHESIVNKNDTIAREECFEDFSETSTAKSQEIEEGAMKAITLSGSSDAMSEEASPDDCQTPPKADDLPSVSVKHSAGLATTLSGSSDAMSEDASPDNCQTQPKADNLPSVSAKHRAGLDSQVDQSEDKEECKSLPEDSEISKFRVEETVMKFEGSPTVMFKSEKIEVTLMPTVAEQGVLIARDHTQLSVTNVADQVVSWDYGESSVMDRRRIENELEDPEFRGACTSQHALTSLDAGDVGVSRAATEDSIVNKDETMAPEDYFEDFCWSFPDTGEEARVVDSQLAMESTPDKADRSSESGNDVGEEQNRSSDLKQSQQTEDSEECVPSTPIPSTPMQPTRNFEPCSAIDVATRNKENTVGLKMGSTQKQNEKSAISTSSRRPLQSVPRTKSDH